MKIKADDITKFVQGGSPSKLFADHVIVYSEMEVRANIYNAMKYIQDKLQPEDSTDKIKPCSVCHCMVGAHHAPWCSAGYGTFNG